MLTAMSPIISPVPISDTSAQCTQWLTRTGRAHGEYTEDDISKVILPYYVAVCTSVNVPIEIAISQVDIESDGLNSALSQRQDKDGRNLRNGFGIGVYEARDKATPFYRNGCVWDADAKGYRPACQFANWQIAARAHVGRLVAWATVPSRRTTAQTILVADAMRARPLDRKLHGSAPKLLFLGAVHNPYGIGWASPGDDYGAHIARVANAIIAH